MQNSGLNVNSKFRLNQVLGSLFIFSLISLILGCASNSNIKKSSYNTQTYNPITKTTRTTNQTNTVNPSINITRNNDTQKNEETYKKMLIKEKRAENSQKNIIQSSSLSNSKTNTEVSPYINDLLLDKNRYVIFKNVSGYFGERKIKSIIYAVGDFNNWGQDKTVKVPVCVENDSAKLDLYELPLLKGPNRIGFADYSGNLWILKEDLYKNNLISQSTDGSWVIGIIVTQEGSITFFKNGDKQKLIPKK